MTVQEFCNQTINKKIDVDGAYENQCVDLFNYFNKLMNGGVYINCRPSGYAKSIYENRANNGVLNYYDVVPINKMQDGDWAIWGNCKAAPDSHIAMFRRDNGNDTGVFLSQTYRQVVVEQNISYFGLIGALRPKQYASNNIGTTQKVYLPAAATSWRIYPLDKQPTKGNECGYLKPSKFGGLEYDILGWSMKDVAIIQTRDYGKVQIYIAPSTGAIIK